MISVLVQKCDYDILIFVANNQTILHGAIKIGQLDVIKWINTKSNFACYYAVASKQLKVLKWLFDNDYTRCHDLLNVSLTVGSIDIFQWLLVYDYNMVHDYRLLCCVSPYHAKDAYEKGYSVLNDRFISDVLMNGDIKFVRWFVQKFCARFHSIVGKFHIDEHSDGEWLNEYHKYNKFRKSEFNILIQTLKYQNFDIAIQRGGDVLKWYLERYYQA